MPNLLPAPALIFIVYFFLFAWDEFYGLMALLAGYILFDRNFAYTHIIIDIIPIFITEFCLLTWLVCRLVYNPTSFIQAWKGLPHGSRRLWVLFLAIGCYSFLRGLYSFNALITVRDFALCYYSLVFFLVSSMRWSEERCRRFYRILILLALVRAIFIADVKLWALLPAPAVMKGQPAAMSLSLAIAFIGLLSMKAFNLAWYDSTAAILILSALLIELVRSSWTGLGMALIASVWMFLISRKERWALLSHLAKSFVIISLGTALVLFVSNGRISHTPVPETPLSPHPVKPPSTKGTSVTPASSPRPQYVTPSAPQKTITSFASPTSVGSSPVGITPIPAKSPTPLAQVYTEFLTLFQGFSSNNVMTRIWLWRNAWWELSSTGLFSPTLQEADLKHYNMPLLRRDGVDLFTMPIRAEGLKNDRASIQTHSIPEKPTWAARGQRLHRLLFGIPFGKPFLPPEVVWMVNSPNRYDPHNSFVAVAYRMGVVGIITLLCLIASLMAKPIAQLMKMPPWQSCFYIATWASLTNVIVHTLTDNTLENPFKGLWLWVLLGLLCRLKIDENPNRP